MPRTSMVGDNFDEWTPFANPTFALNDVLYLVQIPNGATLYYFAIALPQLDTGTSLTLDVGDNVTTTSGGAGSAGYFSASTIGRSATAGQNNIVSGTNSAGNVLGGIPFTYSLLTAAVPTAGTALGTTATNAPAGIWLTLHIHAAAQTATTTGSIYGYVKYSFSPSTASQTNPFL
jgi:hypothetical protein